METIAAIIPTYNRKEQLRECLYAVMNQSRPLDAIVVVDNGSTDGTREMIATEFPDARCLHLPVPCGSAGGFNRGIAYGYAQGYEWLWLMDNDAIPASDALAILVDASRSAVGDVFNSLVVTPDGETINWGYNYYKGAAFGDGTRLFQTVRELESLGTPIVNGLAQFYPGALIRRSVIAKVGLPTLGYFTRGDEVDYALRVQQAGFPTYTVPASRVTHPAEPRFSVKLLGRESIYPVMPPAKQYYAFRNTLINSSKYAIPSRNTPGSCFRLLISYTRMSLAFPDGKLRRLWYTILAFVDGLSGRLYVKTNTW